VKPGYTGFKRLRKASQYSWAGLKFAWRDESAFRQECALGVVLIPLAFWLGETWLEIAMLIGVYALVLISELLNTGVELAVDLVDQEPNELAGRAKDIASAAVALSLLLLGVVWALAAAHRLF